MSEKILDSMKDIPTKIIDPVKDLPNDIAMKSRGMLDDFIEYVKKIPEKILDLILRMIRKFLVTIILTLRKIPIVLKNIPRYFKKFLLAFRIPVLLMVTFALSFSISAGTRLVHSSSFEKMFPQESIPKNSKEDSLSFSGRVHRAFFLKQEIASNTTIKHFVQLEDISPRMKEAIVAVEDSKFYSHKGFDVNEATINQQLIKNIFPTETIEEIILAVDLEMNYSKDEILELYLNTANFGSGFNGIYEASYGYFGVAPSELNLAESAILAGLPKAPSVYSPYVNYMIAKKRQITVLDSMVRDGFITRDQAERAKIDTVYLKDYDRDDDY